MKRKYQKHGNELSYFLQCTCPHPLFKGTDAAHVCYSLELKGENTDEFFDVANAQPMTVKCRCGRKASVQWFRDGVVAKWED